MKLNTNINKLKPSATLLINEEVKKLRKKGFEIFHFGFEQSPFSVPKTIVKSLIENTKCTQPQGAFYLLISFDLHRNSLEKLKIFTNTELAFYILNKYKVSLLPGIDFYFNKDELIFRLAYVDFNGRKAINEFKRNKGKLNDTFVLKVAPNINSGIRNLIEFVNTLK